MQPTLTGFVTGGYGIAGKNLEPVLALIEERSGLTNLIPNTLNLRLLVPFRVVPDFILSANEYNGVEEIRFKHCKVSGQSCLIMRPDSHEAGSAHGPAHLELLSSIWLRKAFGLQNDSQVVVEI